MNEIRITRLRKDEAQAAEALRRELISHRVADVTPAEASALCGLPLELCTRALFHLASSFPARLRVDDAGTIRFTFASLRPPEPSAWDRGRRRAEAWVRRHRSTLMAYGTATLAPPLLLALATDAMLVARANDLNGMMGFLLNCVVCLVATLGFGTAGILMYLKAIPCFVVAAGFAWLMGTSTTWCLIATAIMVFRYALPFMFLRYALPLVGWLSPVFLAPLALTWLFSRGLTERERRAATQQQLMRVLPGVWAGAQGFLFGPPSADLEEDATIRRLAAYIARRGGVVTIGELMGIAGWDATEASERLPRLMADFGGTLVVTDEGGLVCRFDPLAFRRQRGLAPLPVLKEGKRPRRAPRAPAPIMRMDVRPYFERTAEPPSFWGCPPRAAVAALAAGAVGLCGLAMHPEAIWFPSRVQMAKGLSLGVYPYLAVAVALLARLPGWLRRRSQHRAQAGLRALWPLAMERPEGRLMTDVDMNALVRLGGEVDVERSEGERLWIHFPLLASAARAATALRSGPRTPAPAIVYDTHDRTVPAREDDGGTVAGGGSEAPAANGS